MTEYARRTRAATATAQGTTARLAAGVMLPEGASASQHSFNQSVKTALDAGLGVNGEYFRWITRRDLDHRLLELGLAQPGVNYAIPPGGVPTTGVSIPVIGQNGTIAYLSYEAFSQGIRSTKLFRDLTAPANDPARFDDFPPRVRDLLLGELSAVTGQIEASVRRSEETFQDATNAYAQDIVTIKAKVQHAAAGVREVRFAAASYERAVAGIVTQVSARLDDFDGGGATVETVMTAIADRATGLEARYTVKVTAGGAMAGFGLAITSNASSNSVSAFIIQADKFAIVSSSYAGGLDLTPDLINIPFGVDADGAYVGGNLKVTGIAMIDGNLSIDSYATALTVNSSLARQIGVYAKSNSNLAAGGHAILAVNTNGGIGIEGDVQGGSSGYGVYGAALGSGKYGVHALGSGGAFALLVTGQINIATAATTGASTCTFTANKPGSTNTASWIECYNGATRGYVPWVAH